MLIFVLLINAAWSPVSIIYSLLFKFFQKCLLSLCQFGVFSPGKPFARYELESTGVDTFATVWHIDAITVELYADASILASI